MPDPPDDETVAWSRCFVRDYTTCSADRGSKFAIDLCGSSQVQRLIEEVLDTAKYPPDSFLLTFQRADGEEVVLNDVRLLTLVEAGLETGGMSRNNLTLQDVPRRRQLQQQRVPADGASDGEEAAAPRTQRPTVSFKPLPLAIEAPPGASSSKLLRGVDGAGSIDTNYVGLVNQAMTCYLNSLLQSLFMTPEFRNAMYMWEYDGNMRDAHKSIPFQLQKLFLHMQTSDRPAVETTALTCSFGWDSSEAWQQHDIQELCRVMFDALEVKFKRTQQSDLISRLYEGKMIDYVRCLECGTEKDREDTYLDIPLPIRPFGASVAYDSVESALSGFVNPERLDGNNQYFCDNCNRKCDAHKGLKFKTFPYLLTLHLKRFDFDYQTLHRIKLNDRVSFPQLLNLNSFVDEAQLLSCSDAADGCRSDDTSTTDSGAVLDDEPHHIPVHPADPAMQDDEGIECWPDTGEGTAAARAQTWRQATCGPYQYQLFSVMIHSGSASGGHYYAYIRDFASQLWFCFNDQSVTPITQEDIERSFGGGIIGGMGGGYSSSTNAYMLMYRRIDSFHNALPLTQEQFPVWIQKLMVHMRDGEREERASKERERHMCKTVLYGSAPSSGDNTTGKRSITFHIHKDSTLEEATELAWKELSFDKLLPLERCRLVLYNQLDDVIEESLERHFGSTMETVLGGVRTTYKYDLLLDWRDEGDDFETYLPGNTVVQVYTVDTVMTGEVSGPRRLHISLSGSVSELRDRLSPSCGSRLCLVRPRGELHHLTDSLQCSLKSHGLHRNSRLYASVDDPDDERRPVLSSMFHALCDQFQHTVSVQIVVPRTDPATLERFGIPSLSDWLSSEAAASGPSDRQLSPPSPPCSPPDEPPLAATTGGWSDVCDSARSSDQSASENSSVTTDSSQRTLIGAVGDSCPPADESCPGAAEGCDVADGSCAGAAGGVQDVGGSVIVTPSNSPAGSDYQSMLSAQDVVSAAAGDVGLDDAFMSWVNTSQYVQSVIPTMMNEEQTEEERCHFSVQTETCRGSDTLWEVRMDDRMTVNGFKKELECRLNVHRDHLKVLRTYSSNMEHECVRGELLSRGDAAHSVLVKLSRRLEEGELRGKIFLLDVSSDSPSTFLFDWILCRGTTVAQAKRVLLAHYKSVKGVDIPPDKCRLRKKSWKNPGKIYLDDFEFGREIPFHVNWELFLQELPDGESVTDPDQIAVFFRRFYPTEFRVGAVQELVLAELSADTLRARLSDVSGLDPALIRLAKPHSVSLSELPSAGAVLLSTLADIDWIHEFKGLDAWPLNIQEDGQVLVYKSSAEPLADAAFQQQRLASMSTPSDAGPPSVPTQPRRERALRIRLDSSH